MPVTALDHVSQCHIHPFLAHLQGWLLHHLPGQLLQYPATLLEKNLFLIQIRVSPDLSHMDVHKSHTHISADVNTVLVTGFFVSLAQTYQIHKVGSIDFGVYLIQEIILSARRHSCRPVHQIRAWIFLLICCYIPTPWDHWCILQGTEFWVPISSVIQIACLQEIWHDMTQVMLNAGPYSFSV